MACRADTSYWLLHDPLFVIQVLEAFDRSVSLTEHACSASHLFSMALNCAMWDNANLGPNEAQVFATVLLLNCLLWKHTDNRIYNDCTKLCSHE